MPKMKTHSGAKKRFKLTATGKLRGRHAFTSHILEKKTPKRKRALGRPAVISGDDSPRVRRMLAVSAKGVQRPGDELQRSGDELERAARRAAGESS
jgi:large subunit ribosomal protein L35